MTYEANTGLGVHNHYGPRANGPGAGVVGTQGIEVELVIDLTPEVILNGGPLLVDYTIPAGAIITAAYVVTTTAFTFGNADNVIDIGTDTTEATNGFSIASTIPDGVGTAVLTGELSGTWAAPLAADTKVGVALSGTTPAATGGVAKAIILYVITA
jgi:hypothetical protein